MKNNNYSRRQFLSSTAMGLLGYSLMVNVDANAAQPTNMSKSTDSMAERIRSDKSQKSYSQASMEDISLDCDVLVAGGGLAGICAAIAAAREGAKVVLVQNRSRLGGNTSSEIRMHPLGINSTSVGFREAGILEEIKLKNVVENTEQSWAIWDILLYDKCRQEKNITLLLDTTLYAATVEDNKITKAYARCDLSLSNYIISAKQFIDCTGDCRLAIEAGAEVMTGRDGEEKYGESLASVFSKGDHLCCSILFTSRDAGREVKFTAPSWAKKITEENLQFRDPKKWGFNYGYWFISFGGKLDTVRDMEVIRRELLSIILGVWDYVKNSGKYPEVKNLDLDFIGMLPARRDTYRVKGYDIFTQHDIEGKWTSRPDQIITVGWPMEDQPSEGFYFKGKPAIYGGKTQFYNLPLTAMYSKDIKNLFMAGRNMNTSHIAFTSTRVMNIAALAGEVAGTAAAKCVIEKLTPRELGTDSQKVSELRQKLMKNGNIIVNFKNEDSKDFARNAKVSASNSDNGTSPQNIINGINYDFKNEVKNRWQAPISKQPEITLAWDSPISISELIFNLDTGCRMITQTCETKFVKKILYAPQPETLRDFDVIATLADGSQKKLAEVRGNYQKLVKLAIEPTKLSAVKIKCLATNGSDFASIFEVRAY